MLYFKTFLSVILFAFSQHAHNPSHKFMLRIAQWVNLQHINNYMSKLPVIYHFLKLKHKTWLNYKYINCVYQYTVYEEQECDRHVSPTYQPYYQILKILMA